MYKLLKLLTVAVFLIGGLLLSSCSSSPSDEELKQLSDLKNQVSSLEDNIRKLQSDAAALEKQIADKNGTLKQCQSDQDAVKKAMGK